MAKKKDIKKGDRVSLYTLFARTPDCWGWAERIPGTDQYIYQNDNDLGLLAETDTLVGCRVKVVDKIPITRSGKGCLYIIDSGPRYRPMADGSELSLEKVRIFLKACHVGCVDGEALTPEEKKIVDTL